MHFYRVWSWVTVYDLDFRTKPKRIKISHLARYLGQMSFRSKVLVRPLKTHAHSRPNALADHSSGMIIYYYYYYYYFYYTKSNHLRSALTMQSSRTSSCKQCIVIAYASAFNYINVLSHRMRRVALRCRTVPQRTATQRTASDVNECLNYVVWRRKPTANTRQLPWLASHLRLPRCRRETTHNIWETSMRFVV